MFGLNETATLYAHAGHSGGKPAYAENGRVFRCRSQPTTVHSPGPNGMERTASVRIFAQGIEAHAGDRIVIGDAAYTITEVQIMRGYSSVHHLEILAREADP